KVRQVHQALKVVPRTPKELVSPRSIRRLPSSSRFPEFFPLLRMFLQRLEEVKAKADSITFLSRNPPLSSKRPFCLCDGIKKGLNVGVFHNLLNSLRLSPPSITYHLLLCRSRYTRTNINNTSKSISITATSIK